MKMSFVCPRRSRRGRALCGALRALWCGVVLAVWLAGCREEAPAPQLTAPEWQDGEVSVYEVLRGDTVLFRRRVTVEFDEESARPLAVVTSVVEPQAVPIYLTDSMTFALRRFSLKPEWLYRLVTTDVSVSEVTARWENGHVEIRKETVDGSEEKTLRVQEWCFAAEMTQSVLRGLPLEPSTELRAQALVPLEFRLEPVTVTVLGTKLVTTRLGDIICREVRVVQGRRRRSLLYELAQPRRLVEVRDPDARTRMLLVEYVPALPDTAAPEVLP